MVNPLVSVRDFSLSRGSFRLKNVSLDIRPNEKFALLGRTGAGKTVLLESIAGFYRGETGTILLDGKPVEKISPEQRGIGFVYQDQGLFPHLTVYHNISYGLRMRKVSRDEIKAQVLRAAELLSIPHIMEQYPATLSGGERQRAALARAMVLKPRLLLLDEPFSALDPTTKAQMYDEMERIHCAFGCTMLFVTHDFQEASRLADRIGILLDGELLVVTTPAKLFQGSYPEKINAFLGIQGRGTYDRTGTVPDATRSLL